MKRLTTFLLALMLMSIGAKATDYTSSMQTSSTTGWTGPSATQGGGNGPTVMSFGMEAYAYMSADTYWPNAGKVLYQTITGLPEGTYKVQFYAFARVARTVSLDTYAGEGIVEAYASGASTATQRIDIPTSYVSGHSSWTNDDIMTLVCKVGSDGTLEYGLQNVAAGGQWYGIKEISLTLIDGTTDTWTGTAYAHGCVTGGGSDWGKPAHWTADNDKTTNLHVNTHSTEADPSGMVTPFVEYWYASGTNLPDDVLRHDQLTNLTPGYYNVSIDVRAFNESGTTAISTGVTTFNAVSGGKTASADITTLTSTTSYDSHYELYGTLSLMAEVTDAGTLDINFTFSNANYNWLAFKNLDVVYMGTSLEYAIGAPQCAVSCVKPGSEVSITFPDCITPNAGETPTLSTSVNIEVDGTKVSDATLSYSSTTATVTFTMPTSVGYGETVTVTVPAGLLSWSGTSVSSAEATFTLTTPVIADQPGVYLYSTHADGFLSRGGEHLASENTESYGKIATTDPYGIPVDITFGDDGYATVKFLDSNLYLYGGGWAWTDGSNAAKYTVDVLDVDGETVYQFSYDGNDDNYLYVNDEYWDWVANNGNFNGDDNLKDDITRTYWQIFTMAERDDYKEAFVASQKAKIAGFVDADDLDSYIADQPQTDMTYMVADAALAGSLTGWTETDYYSDNNGTYFTSNTNGTEIYKGDARLLQTVSGLSEGVYKVTLQGFVRQGFADNIVNSGLDKYDLSIGFLQANGYQINLKPWATEADLDAKTPDGMDNAWGSNNDGTRTYPNELYTYVGDDGTLELSINCPDVLDGGWMMFKNLTLTYYGMDEYTNDVTWKLANPSFEVDNVAYLEEDATRSTTDDGNATHTGGAYTIGENGLTGWTLVAPTSNETDRAIADLMTAACKRTDNGYGAPGTPSDGDQILYLRCAWETNTGSVTQTVSLPEGSYKLTVDSKCVTTGSGHSATLVVGDDKSVTLPTHTVYSDELAWDTSSITFEVGSGGEEVTIGVKATFAEVSAGFSVALDNFKLYSTKEITESISWNMTDAGWGTLILPFDVASIPDGLTAYAGDALTLNEDDSTITVGTEATSIEANTPYLVSGTEAKTYEFTGVPTNEKEIYSDGLLTGTLVNLAVAKGAAFATDGTQYLLQKHNDNVAFYPIIAATDTEDNSKYATLDAYHCYLTLTSGPSGVRAFISLPGTDDEATRIEAVEGTEVEANGAIYDLSGRKVSKAVKGVYIMNGKKVMVK